jgi:hypothetical protein
MASAPEELSRLVESLVDRLSVMRSICIISGSGEVVCAFAGCEGIDQATNRSPKGIDGPFAAFRRSALSLEKALSTGFEAWTVGREAEEACPCSLNHFTHARALVDRQVVHDDDVTRPELRHEALLDIANEGVAVD